MTTKRIKAVKAWAILFDGQISPFSRPFIGPRAVAEILFRGEGSITRVLITPLPKRKRKKR